MNQSERNYYEWLLKRGHDPEDIEFQESDTPDFIVGEEHHEVKKRYGNLINVHSDSQAQFIEESGEGAFIALMPEDPSESAIPLSVIPLSEISSVDEEIEYDTIRRHSPRDKLPFWSKNFSFNLAYEYAQKVHARVDEDLIEEVDEIIENSPEFENRSHAVRVGLRMVVQDQDYRDAE